MKIGFDAKRFFHNSSGLGNYSRDLVYKMQEIFPKNEYFLFNPKKNNKIHTIDEEKKNYFVEITPKKLLDKKLHFYWRSKRLVDEIKNNGLDVYHGLSAELPSGIQKLESLKKVVTVHDLIFIRYPELYNKYDVKIYKSKVKYACRVADVIVATSNQTKEDIVNFLGIDEKKIKVIYQGCNDVYTQDYNGFYKINVIKKYGLPQKYILNVGTVEKRKNLLTIIKALKNLPEDISLVVIGKKTKYYKEINKHIDKYNLKHRIWFLENVSIHEMGVIYKMASVFVYPSIFEGFGIPILEAIFSKTPVITSDVSSLPEVAGENSFKISPYDHEALGNKILEIFENEKLAKNMVERAYEEALNKFDKENLVRQVFEIYN